MVKSEEHLQQAPDAFRCVEASGQSLTVPVVLDRAIQGVGVGVEPVARDLERLVGTETCLVGQDPGDASVEPVEHYLGTGESVAFKTRHPGCAELGERDDDEVEFGGPVSREPGEIGPRVVGEDHVQVVVGVRGHHAVVGSGTFEDKADDR
ncbi:hypothetical protein GCM10022207_75490 [Streptomyces lannensis]|uniref:Uncharacterized protein n=1 Tax=Streptomyces lannensis TaxID=766498 RepID=A0ABP7LC15_9ACTN